MALSISGRSIPSNPPSGFARKVFLVERVDENGNTIKKTETASERAMLQIADPYWEYVFAIPPGQVSHEGYGVTLNEIQRPYLTPIVDVTSGKSLRASFEFPIVARQQKNNQLFDGLEISVDSEIKILQEFANFGVPVQFQNMHPALATPTWYIDNITFNHTRIGTTGATAQATCQLSLIEFANRSNTMILLPRFSYGKFDATKKKETSSDGNGPPDFVKATLELREAYAKLARQKAANKQDSATRRE